MLWPSDDQARNLCKYSAVKENFHCWYTSFVTVKRNRTTISPVLHDHGQFRIFIFYRPKTLYATYEILVFICIYVQPGTYHVYVEYILKSTYLCVVCQYFVIWIRDFIGCLLCLLSKKVPQFIILLPLRIAYCGILNE